MTARASGRSLVYCGSSNDPEGIGGFGGKGSARSRDYYIPLGSGHGQLLRAVFLNYFRKTDRSAVLRKTWFYEGNSLVFRMGPQQLIDIRLSFLIFLGRQGQAVVCPNYFRKTMSL